ncbi:MAG: hypothetical protein ACXWWN_07110 [Gemmatimonadales bacterium]
MAAVQQRVLRRHCVGPVSVAGVVVSPAGSHERANLGDGSLTAWGAAEESSAAKDYRPFIRPLENAALPPGDAPR